MNWSLYHQEVIKHYNTDLFHCHGLNFDSSIPFLCFTFQTKTHLLNNGIKSLSSKQKLIHNIIFKLKSQGYGFKQISDTLNKQNIRTNTGKKFYRSLVWNIYKKRLKRNEFMSQPVIKEYRNFDIEFVGLRWGKFNYSS